MKITVILPAAVTNRRVASLWHEVRVLPPAGRQLPRTNGRRRSRRRTRVQIQHGLLGKTLPFWAWAVFHLHREFREDRMVCRENKNKKGEH